MDECGDHLLSTRSVPLRNHVSDSHKTDESEVIVVFIETSSLRFIWVKSWNVPWLLRDGVWKIVCFRELLEEDLSTVNWAHSVSVSAVVNHTVSLLNEESISGAHICEISTIVLRMK